MLPFFFFLLCFEVLVVGPSSLIMLGKHSVKWAQLQLLFYFLLWDRALPNWPGCSWTCDLPTSASWSAGITGQHFYPLKASVGVFLYIFFSSPLLLLAKLTHGCTVTQSPGKAAGRAWRAAPPCPKSSGLCRLYPDWLQTQLRKPSPWHW